jgi:hypothetical protein
MLLMDVQIWIVNNVANDPHGVVERAAPGGCQWIMRRVASQGNGIVKFMKIALRRLPLEES